MNRGYSFIELLIVTTILAIVTAAIFPLLYQGQQSFRSQKQLAEMTQSARIAMDQITRFVRQAGNDPLESMAVPAIQILGDGYLQINSDITGSVPSTTGNNKESTGDPQGTLNSIYEQVVVRYDAVQKELYMDVGYGEELLAEDIADLNFSFFDASGNSTTDPASIVRVKVEIIAETAYSDPTTGRISSVTLASDVFIRARSYELFQ